jgi:hypothetical protein
MSFLDLGGRSRFWVGWVVKIVKKLRMMFLRHRDKVAIDG